MISNLFKISNFKFQIRKTLSIILISLILLTSIKYVFLRPGTVLADSTLGFNEGYGTTVKDLNSTLTGTITDAVWKSDEFCKVSKCLYFDGAGDLINFGNDSDVDFTTGSFTITGWFRTPDITSGQRTIVAKHNATAGGYKVYIDSNGYLIFGIDPDSTWSPSDSASSSTATVDDNKWHHFVAIKDGTTSISLYVDDKLMQTDSSITASSLTNTDTFYIGMDGDGSSNGFSGFLDEIKVYAGSARTQAEINADYLGETASRGVTASFGPDTSWISNGLVGYWKLDETSGNALDSSGNNNTGINNATDATGGTITYSGGYTIHTFTSSDTFTPNTSTDVEVLVVAGGGGGGAGNLASAYAGGGGGGGGVKYNAAYAASGAISVTVGNGGSAGTLYYENAGNGSDSVFGSITATGGGGGGASQGYAGSAGANGGGGGTYWGAGGTGNDGYNGGQGSDCNTPCRAGGGGGAGAVGEAGITNGNGGIGYNSSITGSSTYYSGGGGGGIYSGTPGSGGSGGGGNGGNGVTGSNGTANTGGGGGGGGYTGLGGTGGSGIVIVRYLTGTGPTPVSGKFGNSEDFELSNSEYLSISDNTALSLTGSITLSAWIKPETVSAGTYNILSKWDGANESYRLMQNADEIRIELDSSGNYVETTASNLATATWYHVVGVYDSSTSTAKVYINGSEATSTITGTIPSSIGDDAGGFQIGTEDLNNTPKNFYDGIIDEARIYNRALSPAEVAKLYSWAPGPIAHFKLDENTGTTSVNDVSGNANTGTMTGSMTVDDWTTGKFGSALDFDGSNDALTITTANDNYVDFNTSETFSGSVWIYIKTMPGSSEQDAIITKWDATSTTRGYRLFVENDDADTTGNFQVDIYDESTDQTISATGANDTVNTNTWYHLSFTFNGGIAGTANDLNLYTNSVLTGGNSANASFLGLEDVSADFSIGDYDTNDAVATNTAFTGIIDDIHIYNYIRTPGQIIEDMNGGHPAPGSPVGSSVAYWKFDEGYSTTAYDNSINANNLTTAVFTNNGKFGKAFDGADNRRLTGTNDTDFEPGASEGFSISTWVKSDGATTAASEYVVSKVAASAAGYDIYFNTSGQLVCEIDDDTASYPEDSATTTTDYYDTTWHHIVCVRDIDADKLNLFVDGKLVAQDTDLSATGAIDNSAVFYLGDTNGTDGTDEFLGDIDETKFYRSALTAEQVKVEYNRGSGQQMGSLSTDASNNPSNTDTDSYCPPGQGSACTPPVGHWKLDENTGTTTTYDSSGNGRDGTMTNLSADDWVPAKYGSGINFDKANDKVSIADNDVFSANTTNQLTVEAWFYADSPLVTQEIVNKGSGGAYEWALRVHSDGNTYAKLYNPDGSDDYLSASVVGATAVKTWYHLAFVADISIPSLKLYRNGILIAEDTTTFGTYANNTAAVRIGERQDNAQDVDGTVDDVRIYNYARTQAQIAWDMNRGAPIGRWKLDENTGTAANDSMGNSTAGTLTNSPTWVTGKLNTGVSFAGSNQHVLIGDDPDFDFADDEDMSLTTWFKHSTASAQEIILSKYAAAGYKIIMESDGDITCAMDYDSTWTPTDSATSTAATYDDDSWHHVACVKTGATSLALYIDGVLIDTDSSITATNTLTNADPLYLGIDADGTSLDFTGSLDDVRIYRYPLTSQQIKTVMNNGSAVKY